MNDHHKQKPQTLVEVVRYLKLLATRDAEVSHTTDDSQQGTANYTGVMKAPPLPWKSVTKSLGGIQNHCCPRLVNVWWRGETEQRGNSGVTLTVVRVAGLSVHTFKKTHIYRARIKFAISTFYLINLKQDSKNILTEKLPPAINGN